MNIAIIGIGNIAHRVAKGIQCANNATLYGVASTDETRARKFAQQYGAQVYYGSYAQLLSDDKVEVVYLCTPNHLHYEQIMECFSYHKHVICEKPLVANQQQVKALFAAAKENDCFLMEAEKTLFTPLNTRIKQMVSEGVIGKIAYVKADYNYCIATEQLEKDHWAFDATYGGSSYDVGVYPICFANFFSGSTIQNIEGRAIALQGAGSDVCMDAIVTYDNGVIANVSSSWLYESEAKGCGYIVGEEGYFVIPAFWKTNVAYLVKDNKKEKIEVAMESDFTGEIEHAVSCIQKGLLQSPILSEKESLEIIKVVEKVNGYRNTK